MENNNKYWRGLEELNNDAEFVRNKKNEFMEGIPLEEALTEQDGELTSNRRDFLKYFGFSISAVALAACNKAPVKHAIPYIVKPDNVTPGIPNWYATTNPHTGGSLLVKTREGRPVKIEGNPDSPIYKGGVSAIEHASLLGLYDNERLRGPKVSGADTSWDDLDTKMNTALASASNIRIVTSSIASPSVKQAVSQFINKYPSAKHIAYESVSYNGITVANDKSFNKAVVPSYNFAKAKVIVSFGADFLGTWISPVEYAKQWVSNRKPQNGSMSRHYQFESGLSLTGANADVRIPIKPSAEGVALISLYNKLATLAGAPHISNAQNIEFAVNMIEITAKELWSNKGNSLVVSGSNIAEYQMIVNAINSLLGNYGTTIDLDNPTHVKGGNDAGFESFVKEMNAGGVDAVIFWNVNPAYAYYNTEAFKAGLAKVKTSVSTAMNLDETASLCNMHAPDNHFLESWGDSEPRSGYFAMTQPTISPVFNTRSFLGSILAWSGNNANEFDYIKNNWIANICGSETAFNKSLHDGFFVKGAKVASSYTTNVLPTEIVNAAYQLYTASKDKLELQVYTKVGIGDGAYSNNPWLQEMPDPISKVVWDNYAMIGKVTADQFNLKEGDLITIKTKNGIIENVPVLVQPGQANNTISVALGYGRTEGGKVAKYLGKSAYSAVSFNGNTYEYTASDVSIDKTGKGYKLAKTQTHHTIEGRNLIREASLNEFIKDPKAGNHYHAHIISLWEERDSKGHKWGMAIDMNACTGCGACVVSCNAENNVPVVGKAEVLRGREMHWIRIDRYYRFRNASGKLVNREKGFAGNSLKGHDEELIDYGPNSTTNFEDVAVTFQPIMCQQCGNAPCETVCPVLATVHSSEGLNHMAYNRCVGTRYCANNCPFKVRRFNWFKYRENDDFDFHFNNDLGRMVVNPDVTVRSRGVMEKCSFCIQRIQAGKLTAKIENRKVQDGDIKTACQQSCPTNAIVFGDMNDPNTEISKLFNNDRSYVLLEEYNVAPSVAYMTKIRNVDEELAGGQGHQTSAPGHEDHHTDESHS
jgi:MoCo/4Fe-4S cofactor protein with predicted Tat translocation signal